jgi:SPP1 family predicted phage head-tail adaptor
MKANMRLTVQTKTGGGNFEDDPPESWEMYTVDAFTGVEWFAVEPISGREFIQNQQVKSNISHKAECTYFSGANSAMRLVSSDGRTFNVASVTNRMEHNRKLDWLLTEV